MEQQALFVPLLVWLIGGSRIGGTYNDYYGSVTQDPAKPMWGQKIFNYRVAIEKIDDEEYVGAAWYPGMQAFKNTPADDVTSKTFACTAQGCDEAKAWLEEQKAAFFAAE